MYTVIAKIVARSEDALKVKKSLIAVIEPTRLEDGCKQYVLHQALDDMSVFMFYEVWANEEAFDAHMNSPHIKAWADKYRSSLKSWKIYLLKEIQ